ncbi:TPA: hypothetical protein ACXJNE_003806 [Pseudomonas aeruginosa]|nr:hypothetical protein [Pseudomonas aeruginosa]HCJ6265393.1 hypothetical protein [Pseudomonas aeruginosa]
MSQSSQRYVDFIGGLMPLYQQEDVQGLWGARSLRDGTLFLPQREIDDGQDDDRVTVWWQGDAQRATDTDGSQLASIALVDYVQFHSVGKASQHTTDLLEHLSQHFTFKTGGNLYLPYAEEELRAFGRILEVIKNYGPDLALDALKKSLGF